MKRFNTTGLFWREIYNVARGEHEYTNKTDKLRYTDDGYGEQHDFGMKTPEHQNA